MFEAFFNLTDQPFRLSPDHRFFYCSSAHNRALAHLKFGLDQKEGFILITGEVGAGKTTLVDHLLASLNPRQFVAANIVTSNLDQDNMIRMIASSFGLTQEGLNRTSVFRNIERFMSDAARQEKRCLLFVDEAQNLSITALEELRMLSNLQVDGRPALQSFLLGQPQFRQTLARPDLAQLRQRVIASYHLGPLNREETRAYIQHRLDVVGWQNDPVFDEGAIEAVFDATDGIPRRVNTLCNRLMLNACLEELHLIDIHQVKLVSDEINVEMGLVVDFESEDDKAFVGVPVVPEPDAALQSVPCGNNLPLPHVASPARQEALEPGDGCQVRAGLESAIPDVGHEEPLLDVVDLTIRAREDVTLETEKRVKKKALHTVINFLGGRGS